MKKDKRLFILNKNKFFPKYLEVNLLICSKECANVYLGPAKFKHICDCGLEFKRIYNLKYEIANKSNQKRLEYDEMPNVEGNTSNEINWIDDISYEDLINGKVDCIGSVEKIPIALAVCTKECGNVQLIYDGAPQTCPKCGKQLFRVKVQDYKLINK